MSTASEAWAKVANVAGSLQSHRKPSATSETVEVYRIQDAAGIGPYRSHLLPQFHAFDEVRHPAPSDDSKLRDALFRWADGAEFPPWNIPWNHAWRCGFTSVQMLRAWFYDDEWLEMFRYSGYKLMRYTVPADKVLVGYTQCVFDPADHPRVELDWYVLFEVE
jgi:hypothetical protein